MSTTTRLADQLPQLIDEQRRDGDAFDGTLSLSNMALAAGDLVAAERHGRSAEDIMARIRVRSRAMVEIIDGAESRIVDDQAGWRVSGTLRREEQ